MKRLLAACLVILILGLAGCGSTSSVPASQPQAPSGSVPAAADDSSTPHAEKQDLAMAGLKGPTTMGMVRLMSDAEAGQATHNYQVEMFGTADEVVPKLISGDIPVAAVPANLASVLYNNSGGKVQVAAINTLGVLYVVEAGDSVRSVEDLRGKTIYSTGKGTTPEFALNYILVQNGIDPEKDVNIEFKSEATEIAALLKDSDDGIAVLPQPYVTAVMKQNEAVRMALSLTDEWDRVSDGSRMVTGVLVANAEWLAQNQNLFADFLADYERSIDWVLANTADAAELVAKYGIVEQAPIAAAALPHCNLTYIGGAEMKQTLQGYLQVLYDQLPEAVGGAMPDDAFYYGA